MKSRGSSPGDVGHLACNAPLEKRKFPIAFRFSLFYQLHVSTVID